MQVYRVPALASPAWPPSPVCAIHYRWCHLAGLPRTSRGRARAPTGRRGSHRRRRMACDQRAEAAPWQANRGSTGASGSPQASWHSLRRRCRSSRKAIHPPPSRQGAAMRCSGARGVPRRSICCAGRSVRNLGSVRCYLCHLALRRLISRGLLRGGPRMHRRICPRQRRHSCGTDMRRREDANGRRVTHRMKN